MKHRKRSGFSLIELLIVVAIIITLAALATPLLNRNRMFAQEAAAVQHIQTIHKVIAQYYSQFGKFPSSLAELGAPATGNESARSAGLIPGDLARGKKAGFLFAFQQTTNGYAIVATPEVFGSTGRRTFYSDQTGVIRQDWSASATADSPELK